MSRKPALLNCSSSPPPTLGDSEAREGSGEYTKLEPLLQLSRLLLGTSKGYEPWSESRLGRHCDLHRSASLMTISLPVTETSVSLSSAQRQGSPLASTDTGVDKAGV